MITHHDIIRLASIDVDLCPKVNNNNKSTNKKIEKNTKRLYSNLTYSKATKAKEKKLTNEVKRERETILLQEQTLSNSH